ncbi:hypothetical protein CK503_14565 [Aliifodinibius salipaludis]|uniref:ArnR1-like winged helix-turn-helix domain-containing protein n=1 Tax=Fodinibius salipaludis TaxID=2032627 RepID=A0A2A2G7S9_9BACT|nr:hypothetical protein [Aliifodinibius salipaludis]PAU92905.1 hypothetical protein CK503_14565 [Aliifodinibius salipaludis]
MIIGNEFSKRYQWVLKVIGALSQDDTSKPIPVKKINATLKWDRTEIKHVLEYLQELELINIETIGGPLLYGHITITESGAEKYKNLIDQE